MSSSGLIYAAIVALWAAYLVPMWLRRQDELAESGSQDRLFTAMRVLTRRSAAAEPAEEVGTDPEPSARGRRHQRRSAAEARRRARAASGQPSRRRAVVLARRRRVVSVLFLAFTAGSALTAAYGGIWVTVPAVTGLLLSLYIVYLRAQERRRAELRYRKRRVEAALRRQRSVEPEDRTSAARAGAGTGRGGGRDWDDGQDHGDTWDPVPVPLPTYVTAPVAPGTPMWTYKPPAASHDTGDGAEDRGPAVYDQYSDLEERRAVND